VSVTIAEIAERLEDRYNYETVGEERLGRTIAAAVRWYNRHAPRKRIGSLTTVANQDSYDLPADCPGGGVLDVYWYPGVDFSGYADLYEQWADTAAWVFRKPSERVIEAINRGYLRRFQRGTWDVREEKLVLIPTPASSGTTVYFLYAGNHELSGEGDAYETIPSEHLEVLVLLTVAELLLDQSFGNIPRPDYTAGFERMKRSHIPRNVREHVAFLRAQASAELSSAVAVEVS
jgi:hypothetical protein